MAGRLEGKVCVITGAGGGMGREGAIVFTGEGAKVCAADIDFALAEETVALCPEGSAFPHLIGSSPEHFRDFHISFPLPAILITSSTLLPITVLKEPNAHD